MKSRLGRFFFRASARNSVATFGIGCAVASIAGCGGPHLANDGTVIFPESGSHGATVVTANGVEFHDSSDVPKRIVRRDANEPWRAPVGFILPSNGRFTKTSSPTILASRGVAIAIRPSDTRVPSWGGEVLMRVDVIAPAAEGTARTRRAHRASSWMVAAVTRTRSPSYCARISWLRVIASRFSKATTQWCL